MSVDMTLVLFSIALIVIGFVAMSSASIEFAAERYNNPFYHSYRYLFHLSVAIVGGLVVYRIPMSFWQHTGWFWLLAAFVLLIVVLIPGIGSEVNGSRRWVRLGPLNLQCSEIAKVCVILYLAGYLVRRQDEVREEWKGFIKPMGVLFFVTILLMAEPDFGATVVTLGTAFGMIFLAGVRLWQFSLVILAVLAAGVVAVVSEPYRMKRLTAYTDPWADQFNTGYQLTQSLIAFGRGEWWGVGLGNSIQKLFYLPESHTDFVFAIYAEEFGFVGAVILIALFCGLIARILQIGRKAEKQQQVFSAYVAYGIALMISGQVFINIGVNTGLLPTKGLTLPFLSYGGSSLMVCCGLLAMVMRIHSETATALAGGAKKLRTKKRQIKKPAKGGENND
ncbi:putative lipid II flippase FtsW [Oceanicoccus sagamiensis]|uniref:Probable peptidoglycan glycosyltransferase FtsW n=1 Tax=Oceanicoccus sagamiensis TaxID=716816 RepID=A0A1X9NGV0_9GAMM|nr:putative lipid II flippase FtsW [Oceanicoccus sagamiensis]ARN76381.1 putative lipid II flippase FtsW [Oceanicoccus sagamiensis]